MDVVKVGLIGFGVVGSGTYHVLKRNAQEIARRVGRTIQITKVSSRHLDKVTQSVGNDTHVVADPMDIITDPDITIVIELIGGDTHAKRYVTEALKHGKHVVTANKALLAKHGQELFELARANDVSIGFEAAVAGGIPIIKAIREGLAANRINTVAGIINGTTNYILTQMSAQGWSFEQALKEAQALGYAEADPTFDIEGVDAGHKITLLSALAFGVPLQFEKAHIEGISQVQSIDISKARDLGYTLKLLGITKRCEKGIELRVHPTLIPSQSLLANVFGGKNAVMVESDAVGATMYYGAGAGSEPTASAVIADLIDITRLIGCASQHAVPALAFQPADIADLPVLDMDLVKTSYYLRLSLKDDSGALAQVANILAKEDISIVKATSMTVEHAQLVFITHRCYEAQIKRAITQIEKLDITLSPVVKLRIEHLDA